MQIYRSNPPRDASAGVPLAAIVAKESSNGTWSGYGSGIGFGTGGLGVFGGSVSGESRSQTSRAEQFTAPDPQPRESFFANGGIIIMVMITVAMAMLIKFGEAQNNGKTGAMVMFAMCGVALVIAAIAFIAKLGTNQDEEAKRNEGYAAYDALRQRVYHRLRYVEQDHVVFDPESGFETPAQREYIMTLVDAIAAHGRTAQP